MTEKNAKRKKGKGERKGKERRRHNSHRTKTVAKTRQHQEASAHEPRSPSKGHTAQRKKTRNLKKAGKCRRQTETKKQPAPRRQTARTLGTEHQTGCSSHPARIVWCFRPGCNFHESNQAAQNCSRHTLLEVQTALIRRCRGVHCPLFHFLLCVSEGSMHYDNSTAKILAPPCLVCKNIRMCMCEYKYIVVVHHRSLFVAIDM